MAKHRQEIQGFEQNRSPNRWTAVCISKPPAPTKDYFFFFKLNYIVLLYNELNCTIFSFIIYFLVIELKLFNGRSCSNDEDHDSELEKIDKRELKSLAVGMKNIWEKLDNFNWQNPDKEIPELKSQMAGLLFLLK